jgi:hypothetical protein
MKRTVSALTFISVLLVTLSLSSLVAPLKAVSDAPQLEWSKTYGRPPSTLYNKSASHYDGGSSFAQTSDGGYVIVGTTEDYVYLGHGPGQEKYSGMLLKADSSGQVQWQNINSIFQYSDAVFQTKDLGYLVFAQFGRYLVKVDTNGNIESNRSLEISSSGVIEDKDGNFILVGLSYDYYTALIAKIDEKGGLLWNKTLYIFPSDGSNDLQVSNVALTSDGGYFVSGWRTKFFNGAGTDYRNLWLLKIDSDYNLQFSKAFYYQEGAGERNNQSYGYYNPAYPVGVFVVATSDGGCLFAGTAAFDGGAFEAPFFVKFDAGGSWIWDRSFTNGVTQGAYLSSAIQAPSGKYLAGCGFPNYEQALIIESDLDGNLTWYQLFNGSRHSFAGSILNTRDRGFAVLGSLSGEVWLAKFAPEFAVTPPIVNFLSPKNQTYNSSRIPLVFNVNKEYSWLGYSLDNSAIVTITGNTTMTGISNGNHSLVVYAKSTFGSVGESETITFIIAVPFPTLTVAAVSVIVAVVVVIAAGLLLYQKKHKQ